ncbi:unnamed protein product [Symbiodinium sp. CCMP2456]|nr:unnamed protein product [Symbiodinium sp. CCMP2456]
MSSCHCPINCCADPDVPEKKGAPKFAKQIGAFTDTEEPIDDSVLAVQDQWYRPQAEKQLPEPDERLRQEIGSFTVTFESAEGYSVLLDPEGSRKEPDPGPSGPRPVDADRLAALISRLQRAEQEAARRNTRIRIPTLTAGGCFLIVAIALFIILQIHPEPSAAVVFAYVAGFVLASMIDAWSLSGWAAVAIANQALCTALANVLLLLAAAALLETATWLDSVCTSDGNFADSCRFVHTVVQTVYLLRSAVAVSDVAAGLIVICFACCIMIDQICYPGIEAVRLLQRLYAAVGCVWLAIGVFSFVAKHSVLLSAGSVDGLYAHVLGIVVGALMALLGGILAHPRFRRTQICFLKSRSNTVGSGLHELLGGRELKEVIDDGQSNFRAVPADKVLLQHFLLHPAQHELGHLYSLSEPAQFGFVDAFISYSWADQADWQWYAIQHWRDAFKQAHNREPLLWIDRYCHHSTEAEASAMMPVFIAGCQNFVSLAGSRYLYSLRSLVEIFAFGELGRSPEELYEMLLLPDTESRGQMHELIDSLDVWKAHDSCSALLCAREAASGRHGLLGYYRYVGLCCWAKPVYFVWEGRSVDGQSARTLKWANNRSNVVDSGGTPSLARSKPTGPELRLTSLHFHRSDAAGGMRQRSHPDQDVKNMAQQQETELTRPKQILYH